MDEELKQLEAELSRLRPLAPRREIRAAIAGELNPPRLPRATRRARFWLTLPIAAGILASVFYVGTPLWTGPATGNTALAPAAAMSTKKSAPQFKPISARNILVSSTDEGFVELVDGTPARRIRQSYVDTITWQNTASKASLTWTVPREEVKVVPVSYQ